jgi:putative DNA primase/helicase
MALTRPEITGRDSADKDPLAVTVRRACELSGLGPTSIWGFLKDGRFEAVRVPGVRRTLVNYHSLVRLLSPAADSHSTARGRGRSRKCATAPALGDARREGHAWRCRCPLHGGRSLVIRDGEDGRVLVTCWGGCYRLDVLAELRRRGLLERSVNYARPAFEQFEHFEHKPAPHRCGDDADRTTRALSILRWAREGEDTIVATYLASRGITFDRWPPSLRFHPRCPRPKDNGGNLLSPLPAMVGLVEHVTRGSVAVHCTYLRPDGSNKADTDPDKAIFGPVAGGAVRLGAPRPSEWLAVAEGIETALSIAVACSMPAWAALSAGGLERLVLPPEATHVVICADHDSNGVGERAAYGAASRWLAETRRVRIAKPPEPDTDFNEVLTAMADEETRHVAA